MGMQQEAMLCVPVDNKLAMLGEPVLVGHGAASYVAVTPREVFEVVLGRRRAEGFFIAHNHPSGNCGPSAEDARVTAKLRGLGLDLGIPLKDHLIFGAESWYSFTSDVSQEFGHET